MRSFWLFFLAFYCLLPDASGSLLKDILQCSNVVDHDSGDLIAGGSHADFESVNHAVEHYFSPLLTEITHSTYFQFFRVDLDAPCPFWNAPGQCVMEGCAVCTAEEEEVPKPFVNTDFGWASSSRSQDEQDADETRQHIDSDASRISSHVHDSNEKSLRELPWTQGGITPLHHESIYDSLQDSIVMKRDTHDGGIDQNSHNDKYRQYLQYLEESDSYMDGRGVLGNPYDLNSGTPNGYNDDHLWTDMAEVS